MILRKVTRTAPSMTLGQHYIRGHLTLTENHFNSTEGIESTQWCLNQQVILVFKHHYASIILVTLWRIIMILIWTEIFLCVYFNNLWHITLATVWWKYWYYWTLFTYVWNWDFHIINLWLWLRLNLFWIIFVCYSLC